jgi:competence protein ComEA
VTFPRGVCLLVILALAIWGWRMARLFPPGHPPPQPSSVPSVVFVRLGEGFPRPGIHQFHDGITPGDVIQMTSPGVSFEIPSFPLLSVPLTSGEALDILTSGNQLIEIKRYWMPAGMRIALSIPLHPDRMTASDWDVLPGIGVELAERIEIDRHENGDFGCLESLTRVRGIGQGQIQRLKPYFDNQ